MYCVCDCVEDCQVNNVLFPMGLNGLWWYTAYVILNSSEDLEKALAKSGHYIGNSAVKGMDWI